MALIKSWVFFSCLWACSTSPKTYGPTYDAATNDAAPDVVSIDAATDVSADVEADAGTDASACSSTLALIAGSSTTLFTAAGSATSILTATAISGSLLDCGNNFGCANPVAMTRFGSGLLAVFASATGILDFTPYSASWAAPLAVGTASTIDGPSLAVIGTTTHLVYQGPDYKYYHGRYTTSWDAANDPVGGTGTNQSYGPRGPAAAAAGTTLVLVQGGSNSYLYDQDWTGSWAAASLQGGAAVQNTLPPSLTALSGGSSELLAAYLRSTDYKVMAVNRASGTWNTTPTLINTNAYSNDPVALGTLPGGKALLVYRGSDMTPYWTMWDGTSTWTTPAAVLGGSNPQIQSVPSIAAGVCGADALVAWAGTGGVTVVPFTAGVFGAPTSVLGTTGAKFVAIGTLP